MDNRPIGIFDSGLGGLTCVKEAARLLPNEDIIYFGDTSRVPYGTRSIDTIMKYVKSDISFLNSFDIKIIIAACGTASSAMLSTGFEAAPLIIDVIKPTVKAALAATKNGQIAVLGTQATISSACFSRLLLSYNADIRIHERACPMFVPIVENGYASSEVARIIAREYLDGLHEADTIILGCTHYPLLSDAIRDIMDVTLIDSGKCAAAAAANLLKANNMTADMSAKGSLKIYVSDKTDNFATLAGLFLGREVSDDIHKVDIEKYL